MRNGSMNFGHQNGTSLCRPLKIPITNSQSNERGRYYLNGSGVLTASTNMTAAPPPLPPRKTNSQVLFSQLIPNSYSLKSVISESNPSLMKTRAETTENNESDRQLSL
ncbi:unnamed protein product, partial [Trichobilharzia regenti]